MTDQGFRLSPGQQRLWELHGAEGAAGYLTQCVVRIDGPLDRPAFEAALGRAAQRYEIFRTTFRLVPAMALPVQVIAPAVNLSFDASGSVAGADANETYSALLETHRRLPFDLAQGPLLRVSLASFGDARYALAISTPALCADGSSLTILVRDIFREYTGSARDTGDVEPLQYADLAEWLGELIESPETDAGREYWRTVARRCNPDAVHAGDLIEPDGAGSADGYRPETMTVVLDAAATAGVDAAAARCGTSADSVLLACWRLLLGQLAGRPDVVLGVTCSGREHEELQDAIGLIAGPLPLPSTVDDQALREMIAALHEAWRDATPWHLYFSWGEFGRSHRERDATAPRSFSFGFDYTDAREAWIADGIRARLAAMSVRLDRVTLGLSCLRRDRDLVATIHYDAGNLGEAPARRLAERLASLTGRITTCLDRPATAVDLLSPAEHGQLLRFSTAGPADGETACLHELFHAQARRTPQRIAVIGQDERLTYLELDERSSRLAHYIRARGVGPETLVGICLEPSAAMVVAIIAVWKAGGGYLPLQPGHAVERQAHQVRDASVRLLLTQAHLLPQAPEDPEPVCLDQDYAAWAAQPSTSTDSGVTSGNVAYAIYTSGSTGGPKGVLIEHAAVSRFRAAMRVAVHPRHDDRPRQVALNAALTFDASVQQLVTILDGDTLHVLPEDVRRDDRLLVGYVREHAIDVLNCTPTQAEALVTVGLIAPGDHCPSQLLIAGEALPASLWSTLAAAPDTTAYNIYGPTECTVNATAAGISAAGADPVIGRPLPGYEIFVLDDRLRPAPIGVPGELFIGGPALARGYLGAPDVTAQRFVPHPFASRLGQRLYRTGDLARWRADGQLQFLGRRDDQVKLHGFRIEPGEIEETLRRHPGVREAAVVLRNDAPGGKRLVAYCLPDTEPGLSGDELRTFVRGRLPEYMVPAAFVSLPAFPLTRSGKLDRRALPPPDQVRPQLPTRYATPRTPEQETLAAVWGNVLGLDAVGIDDSFFDVGGDSIRSIRVRAQAAERGVQFSIQQLFQHRTIRTLSEVATTTAPEDIPDVPPFAQLTTEDRAMLPDDVIDAYPLTSTQAGMVFQSEYHGAEALFLNTRTAHLRAPLDPDAVRRALDELAEAHPVLRTSFDLTGFRVPMQLVHQTGVVPLELYDISTQPEDEQQGVINEHCAAERAQPFDWNRPPFLRVAIHRRSAETFQVTVALHEAIVDGWSVAALLTELFERYQARLEGRPSAVSPPAALYRHHAAAEHRAIRDPQQRAFWERYLDGARATPLPTWPAPDQPADSGRPHQVITVPITTDTISGLRSLARAVSLPLKSVLLTAHLAVIARATGTTAVITGLVANGRPEIADGDRVIGQFLNTLPLRHKLAGRSWSDEVRRTFEAERELLAYRQYPAGYLIRSANGRPFFDTAFNFTNFHVYRGVTDGRAEILTDDFFERTDLRLLADFSVDQATSAIRLTLNCTGLATAQVASIAGLYGECLATMAAAPDDRAPESPATSADDRARLLEWGTGAEVAGHDRCFAQLFEEQVRQSPDAMAVESDDDQLTYAELNSRANRLARLLVDRGIGPEHVVAVLADRGTDLLVAIVAAFKAGGAYLPLDHADPPQRIGKILHDSRASLVLISERYRAVAEAAVSAYASSARPDLLSIHDLRQGGLSAADLAPRAVPGNLAYVIYTSGSTGEPKGALIEQAAMVNHLQAKVSALGLGSTDRVAAIAKPTFDISVWQMLAATLSGGRTHVISEAVGYDPDLVLAGLARRQITVAELVPSMLDRALSADPPTRLDTLRCLVVAGEALSPRLAARWLARYPRIRLVNAYGPAECADNVTQQDIEAGSGLPVCPLGRPLTNIRLYVLNSELTPVPPGVPGQLCVGGAGVGRGYLADPAHTAQAFVPDLLRPGTRMYLTGDRARYLPDGSLEYLGRMDRQLKMRGMRIEPGEIEAVLRTHPAVDDALVTTLEDRLIGYLAVPGPTEPAVTDAVRAYAADRLPPALVPTRLVLLPELPRNTIGKVDHRRLPPPSRRSSADLGAPPTISERDLTRLLSELTGDDPVGVHDDLFEAGLDSIRATQLVLRTRRLFGVEIPLRQLFAGPTIAALAAAVDAARTAETGHR
jgi:amino acid adenylation domain-containing protein